MAVGVVVAVLQAVVPMVVVEMAPGGMVAREEEVPVGVGVMGVAPMAAVEEEMTREEEEGVGRTKEVAEEKKGRTMTRARRRRVIPKTTAVVAVEVPAVPIVTTAPGKVVVVLEWNQF